MVAAVGGRAEVGDGAPASADEVLADLSVPGDPRAVRHVRVRVGRLGDRLGLAPRQRHGLQTAVAEAVLNAIEHGNGGDLTRSVDVQVTVAPGELVVRVTDDGCGRGTALPEVPVIAAKLRGEQRPRGWGLFLMRSLVDELRVHDDSDGQHVVELVVRLDVDGA